MTPTERYVQTLSELKSGDLGLLRICAGQPLNYAISAFDLFTGIWWPLRQQSERAPRREVAWLIAKLYAYRPMKQNPGATLAELMRQAQPVDEKRRRSYTCRFDQLLNLPLQKLEPHLRWALREIATCATSLDWVQLTDDLSIWERPTTRQRWAELFLRNTKRN